MRPYLDGGELTFIPDSQIERDTLKQFMSEITQRFVDAQMDGENLDELVLSKWCDGDATSCAMCGRRYD